jgi:plastocyanin
MNHRHLSEPRLSVSGAASPTRRGPLMDTRVRALVRALLVAWIIAPAVGAASAATINVTAELPDGKPVAGIVVQLHALEGSARPSPPVRAVMDQVDLAFNPDLLVIPVGSTVAFPNTDATSHQVYSFSAAHRFQLPLYRGKPYPPEHFDQAGVVTLGCNIHDNMLAYILVTDAAFFGRTDAAGKWSQNGVPRGRYRVELWHPRLRDDPPHLNRELTVNESDTADVVIRLDKPLRAAPLQKRPRSWDAY